MSSTALSALGPAVALLETSSIARGIEATDSMLKRAAVDLLMTTIVPRGKYLVMIGGAVADVEAARGRRPAEGAPRPRRQVSGGGGGRGGRRGGRAARRQRDRGRPRPR